MSGSLSYRQRVLTLMDRWGEGELAIIAAHRERGGDAERIRWVTLQAGKEIAAARTRLRSALALLEADGVLSQTAPALREIDEGGEEVSHFAGYMDVLTWYGNQVGMAVPTEWIAAYNPYHEDPRWPANSARVRFRLGYLEKASPWARQLLAACSEGAGAAFHDCMTRFPLRDEFDARIAQVEQAIARDEMHHGPERIGELADAAPSAEAAESLYAVLVQLAELTLWQRQEQFGHPVTDHDMAALVGQLRSEAEPKLYLFRALAKEATRAESAA